MSDTPNTELQANHLTYQPSGVTSPILSDVSYTFLKGHMTALLGPNGSGKTTILRHFLSQIKSPDGAVLIGGKDAQEYLPKERSRILSWVPQSSNSSENAFTVEDVVLMARYPYKGTWEDDSEEDFRIADEAMRTVDVLDFKKRDFNSLSGGERQRVLIARALTQKTPWILLDEPTSNLDVRHQLQIMKIVREKVDEKTTSAVVVMHDFNMVERYCDRVVLLKNGKIVATGETKDVMTTELLSKVYEVGFDIIEKDGKRLFFPQEGNENGWN